MMLVVEDVVGAVAVIARTAGTVPEFQVRIIRVRPAAHLAAVTVAPLFLPALLLAHGGAELDGLMGALVSGPPPGEAQEIHQVRPEENDKVENSNQWHQRTDEIAQVEGLEKFPGKQRHIRPGQPLGLEGNNEVEEDLRVRVKHRKGQEYGEIDIISKCNSTLVFTECKYRSSSKFGDPLEAVNLHKQQKICHTAMNFCVKYGYVNYPCRFDVIAIYKDGTIKHIKNAFEYS